jgi:hypothetical protein
MSVFMLLGFDRAAATGVPLLLEVLGWATGHLSAFHIHDPGVYNAFVVMCVVVLVLGRASLPLVLFTYQT